MKTFTILLLALMLPVFCFGGGSGEPVTIEDNYASTTNAAARSTRFTGYLDTIVIIAPTAFTNTVTLTTRYETIFAITSTGGTNTYRPLYPPCGSTGVAIGATTNDYVQLLLVQDWIDASVTTTVADYTNDVSVLYRIWR